MLSLLNATQLNLLFSIPLSGGLLLVFGLCILAVVGFEFVNGFHDTANAVATVIYTRALKAGVAVPWSGLWNFIGVNVGGVAVAMGILKLVPLNELMVLPVNVGACLVLAVLVSSIIWNLGTWYLGIPCSSSHTLIGSLIGAGLAFTFYYNGKGVNWDKAMEIGLSLIVSPLFGFFAAYLLMLFMKHVIRSEKLFHIPQGDGDRPSLMVRGLLITTCTLVSFFHGSNDGQKGVGLFMLILIAFIPARFAIDHSISNERISSLLSDAQAVVVRARSSHPAAPSAGTLDSLLRAAQTDIALKSTEDAKGTFHFRTEILSIRKEGKAMLADRDVELSAADARTLRHSLSELGKVTDFAPFWVILTISIALGLGTMIGWKRIVVTIGEKIGNEHLSYAQGASSEIVAAATIGLSTGFGLPVSTTHVLSSGIAGSMVASGGTKNLNNGTLKSIAMAWVLTLPVCIVLSIALFALFHLFV